jgi:hypothetical protein
LKTIHTEIEINVPASNVWEILTDFDSYPQWNPFIRSFKGTPKPGKRFKVRMHPPGGKPMTFQPVCLKLEPGRELRWLGHVLIRGIFDGEHIFELEEIVPGKTRFIQRENFRGFLVPLIWNSVEANTRQGFEAMNTKLKERAEARAR